MVGRKISHAHHDVAEVAKEAAAQLYDVLMKDNRIRKSWKDQHDGMNEKDLLGEFVRVFWAKMIPLARSTMTGILRDPMVDDIVKERILDALVKDASLLRGRASPKTILGGLNGR